MGLGNFSVEDWVVIGVATLVASCFALHLLQARTKKRSSRQYRLPPGPPKWPIVGNLPQLAKGGNMPHRVTMELAKTYGPVMLLKLGVSNVLYITDPKIAEDCLKGSVFINRPKIAAISYLSFGRDVHPAATPYGEYWTLVKKLVHTELLSNSRMQQFEVVRMEETQETVREFLEASKRNLAVHVRRNLNYLMMNNITRMLMSRKFGLPPAGEVASDGRSEAKDWVDSMEGMFELYLKPMMEDVIPALAWVDAVSGLRSRMRSLLANLDKILQGTLDARKKDLLESKRTEHETRDLLDVMLLSDGGRGLSERSIKATVMDLVGAGTETTALTTEWALSELLANPDIMKKAQQEVDQVVGTERVVRESDVDRMPYLRAVVRETFRLYSGPWDPRSSAVESQVEGYDIPADCTLMVQLWAMGRDPAIWEDPLKFDPERFVGSKAEEMIRKMAFHPFGLGKRMCPGSKLAAVMVHSVLARLIHSFNWSLPNGTGPEQLDMEEAFGLSLVRRTPLTAMVKPRLPLHLY